MWLTKRHEVGQAHPSAVSDVPAEFVAGQLRAIVGIELRINRVEAKAKLSQNRAQARMSALCVAAVGGSAVIDYRPSDVRRPRSIS